MILHDAILYILDRHTLGLGFDYGSFWRVVFVYGIFLDDTY